MVTIHKTATCPSLHTGTLFLNRNVAENNKTKFRKIVLDIDRLTDTLAKQQETPMPQHLTRHETETALEVISQYDFTAQQAATALERIANAMWEDSLPAQRTYTTSHRVCSALLQEEIAACRA